KYGDRRDVPHYSRPMWEMGSIPGASERRKPSRPFGSSAIFLPMARFARVVVVDVAHHVTQRGNARQVILHHDADRVAYLELLRQYSELHRLSLLGYCLMSNHVHLIVVPGTDQALAQALKHTHGRYASYWNARNSSGGHVWQGRFYSCPLDEIHLWRALRYVELNPVRAALVAAAELWPWSSAAAHCGTGAPHALLELERWRKRWTVAQWREHLRVGQPETEVLALRQYTHTGRPLGSAEFVAALEHATLRPLLPRKPGRPKKPSADSRQDALIFAA
ncbi:MAG TPA: transposase, partial [Terriglobales bacterium]|nr:transposase [Terriglobales bacterium]